MGLLCQLGHTGEAYGAILVIPLLLSCLPRPFLTLPAAPAALCSAGSGGGQGCVPGPLRRGQPRGCALSLPVSSCPAAEPGPSPCCCFGAEQPCSCSLHAGEARGKAGKKMLLLLFLPIKAPAPCSCGVSASLASCLPPPWVPIGHWWSGLGHRTPSPAPGLAEDPGPCGSAPLQCTQLFPAPLSPFPWCRAGSRCTGSPMGSGGLAPSGFWHKWPCRAGRGQIL